jgi:hypothetical protein
VQAYVTLPAVPTWEARVSRGTAPAHRVEAELRYAFVAPLLREATVWLDLGCGTGVAAAGALGSEPLSARAVLVDHDAGALAEAGRETPATQRDLVEADLATREGADAVRAALGGETGGAVVVTCFEVLHQVEDFTALVELLVELGERATVVLSVPDDANGALDDPHRRSAWSAGGAEGLRRLVPGDAVALRQVAIRAAAIVGPEAATVPVDAVAIPGDAAAVHHLLAFGPGAARLAPTARARAADVDAERADARRRESDLAYLEARLAQLEVPASG